ncbi:hypothetical protein EW093_14220 [Thiospirochaeta perfilievii]|uniref:Uncharacterized protein n=1 Tax=Thiospirochaeta perfilievii TaxID=252967 RepID=A0A5C1QEJ2_9SPIO|nr:hypothetical protein [Thiospirochaeta perfilievii]QEN05808.1 hypothetical protein EW093_14220 [Thiospirochaeta perfilievii]
MKSKIFLLYLLITISLFSESNILENSSFGIKESRDGYIDLYLKGKSSEITTVLDSVNYLNSRIYIKDSDKRFYLRDKSKFAITVSENQFEIKWRSDSADVIEIYKINNLGFDYSIELINRTDVNRNFGIYLMYDTYFGEDSHEHFIVNDDKIVKYEKTYNNLEVPFSIKSKNEREQFIEFRLTDKGFTKPDSVILGNWDRLAFSKKWPYIPKAGGLFSYGYYSINDSGIGLVFNGQYIEPNESVVFKFGINLVSNKIVNKEKTTIVKEKKWITLERENDLQADDKVVEDNVVEDNIVEDNIVEDNIVEDNIVEDNIVEDNIVEDNIVEDNIVEDNIVEDNIVEDNIVEDNIVEDNIVEDNIVEDNIVEDNIVEDNIVEDNIVEDNIVEDNIVEDNIVEDNIVENKKIKTDKEELLLMLEYIQKKKRGEDVSGYNFNEDDILEKLKERNE